MLVVVFLVVCSDDIGAVGAAASAAVGAAAASTAAACTASRGLRRGWLADRVVTGMVLWTCGSVEVAMDFFGRSAVVEASCCWYTWFVVCCCLHEGKVMLNGVAWGLVSEDLVVLYVFGGHVIA